MKKQIEKIYLFVTDDENEEIAEKWVGPNEWRPLIVTNAEDLPEAHLAALKISKETGKSLKLIRFSNRTEIGDSCL